MKPTHQEIAVKETAVQAQLEITAVKKDTEPVDNEKGPILDTEVTNTPDRGKKVLAEIEDIPSAVKEETFTKDEMTTTTAEVTVIKSVMTG